MHTAQDLPAEAQEKLLRLARELASKRRAASPLSLHETAELRGRLAAWEEDWNAPGMEAYDQL
jgi:hypothetical protein